MKAMLVATAMLLSACAEAPVLNLPQTGPPCVAYGVKFKQTFPRGTRGVDVGCIETAPAPGDAHG